MPSNRSLSQNKKKREKERGRENTEEGGEVGKERNDPERAWSIREPRVKALGCSTRTRRYSPSFHGESTIVCGG